MRSSLQWSDWVYWRRGRWQVALTVEIDSSHKGGTWSERKREWGRTTRKQHHQLDALELFWLVLYNYAFMIFIHHQLFIFLYLFFCFYSSCYPANLIAIPMLLRRNSCSLDMRKCYPCNQSHNQMTEWLNLWNTLSSSRYSRLTMLVEKNLIPFSYKRRKFAKSNPTRVHYLSWGILWSVLFLFCFMKVLVIFLICMCVFVFFNWLLFFSFHYRLQGARCHSFLLEEMVWYWFPRH